MVVPPASVAGVRSGYRAAKRGNGLGVAAAIWCVATAAVSIAVWTSLLTNEASSPQRAFALVVSEVGLDARPPTGLGFASTRPPEDYAEVDLTITNETSAAAALSPSSIVVTDGSGRRLAWATTDDHFLAITSLRAGSSIDVQLYIALPSGASPATVAAGGSEVDL